MGKKKAAGSSSSSPSSSSSSWLTLVKRAFRSPTKDNNSDKRNAGRRSDHESAHEDHEDKKREKRRWVFRKSSSSRAEEAMPKAKASSTTRVTAADPITSNEQRHAVAAEAAVVTAQAALEIARLTTPASAPTINKETRAAVVIQTSFRGYLARRALRALKGLVKLQALVRGHNVRKQAKLTLQCMQSLVRVQDRMRDQRARLSHEVTRNSMFAESNNLWESSYLQDIRDRKSIYRNTNCATDLWNEQPINETIDVEAILQNRKDIVMQRERALSQAFNHQMWRTQRRRPSLGDEKEFKEEKIKWLDQWMASKAWDSDSRASTDRKDNIKTVEMDTSRPYSYAMPRNGRRSASYYQGNQNCHNNRPSTPQSVASPLHRAHHGMPLQYHSPATPSPSKARPIQVRSASPRCSRELERCYSAANTPSLAASTNYWINVAAHRSSTAMAMPNYMAATESAKAKARSQSAPRQRPSTPERDRGSVGSSAARKRLSYPVPEYGIINGSSSFNQNLKSPSLKSAHCGFYGMEQRSNLSCYTESLGGEISPCSTTDLRWFR